MFYTFGKTNYSLFFKITSQIRSYVQNHLSGTFKNNFPKKICYIDYRSLFRFVLFCFVFPLNFMGWGPLYYIVCSSLWFSFYDAMLEDWVTLSVVLFSPAVEIKWERGKCSTNATHKVTKRTSEVMGDRYSIQWNIWRIKHYMDILAALDEMKSMKLSSLIYPFFNCH